MKTLRRFRIRMVGPIFCVLLLAACATPPADGNGMYDEVNDPLESMNRAVFSFNQFADGLIFKPLAILYTMLPTVVQDGIGGMLEREAARCMCKEHVHRLIVIDSSGAPVGVLTSLDLVSAWVGAVEE